MGLRETIRRNGELREVKATLQQEKWQNQHLTESMQSLESQMVDTEWRRLAAHMDREFTRSGLDDLMRLSRAMYLSHPLIKRAVNVRSYYTWGQGVHIQADDETVQAEVIDPMVADPRNKAEYFGHQARILSDVDQQVDGNLFIALFTDINGNVQVRCLPAEEFREIHSSPDDKADIWFYRRRWSEQRFDLDTGLTSAVAREALYPSVVTALSMANGARPDTVGGIEVMWDAPVVHQRTGGLKQMQFGIPETYAALDWARAYRKFLEDWHTIVASLARFAWRMTTKGSKVQSAKGRLGSTITPDDPEETNRPPVAGSVFVGSGSDEMTPIPKTGANTSADDARPSRLMVGAAMDLPDTILSGDADVGNHATAKSLDRPTELAIRSRQSMWADNDRDIFTYAITAKQIRGQLGGVTDLGVQVSFPDVIEHDTAETVTAIVTAATLNGQLPADTIPDRQVSKMLLQALNVEDVEAVLDDLPEVDRKKVADAVERLGL